MGVYIKDMERPKACLACDFCNPFTEEPYCRRLMKVTPKTTTLPDCPLVPVPPHGDLIDRDALNIDISESVVFTVAKNRPSAEMRGAFKVLDRLEIAPTIIEAEEGE